MGTIIIILLVVMLVYQVRLFKRLNAILNIIEKALR